MMYEGKERRLELIRELRIEEDLPPAAKREALEEAAEEAEAGLQAVVDAVQSELVGNSLDRMSKELRRFTEERRVAEIVKQAEKERRVREAQESGRRARELVARQQQHLAMQQVMKVHQQSAASFIDEICEEVVSNDALAQADLEQEVKESRVNTLVDKLEERHSSTGSIASELVHNFLLPEVQRQSDVRTAALEASKFSNAARRALSSAIDKVEEALKGE